MMIEIDKLDPRLVQKNFALWAQTIKVKVDGHPFSFAGHRYLYPLFTDDALELCVMKSAQMGATIWMLLKAIHMALHPDAWGYSMPVNVGFYFPTGSGLHLLVKSRVEPIIESTPYLSIYKPKQRSQTYKPFNESALYFFGMASKVSKDSTPLMILFFDEVRLMALKEISQVTERISHSPLKYRHLVSTAGVPNSDIHKMFLNSDQKWFTTICSRCKAEQVLSMEFPNCIAKHEIGPRRGQCYYICKRCRLSLEDTQLGRYIAHGDSRHRVSGYHFSQLISHRMSAEEIMSAYETTDNITEFWNAKLGMPFVDEDNRPVQYEKLDDNINKQIEWGQESSGFNTMGVDQMMGLNYVFVLNRNGNRRRIVWFEIIEDLNPFARCAQLMEEFNIRCCIADAEPNANEAIKFAREFKGRVYLAKFGRFNEAIRWEDHWKPSKKQKKASLETYYQYRIFLDKYKAHEFVLYLLKNNAYEWPDPNKLVRSVFPLGDGVRQEFPIMRTHAYVHFASAVREKVITDEKSSTYYWKWIYTDGDPHSLDALTYATYAAERKGFVHTSSFFI